MRPAFCPKFGPRTPRRSGSVVWLRGGTRSSGIAPGGGLTKLPADAPLFATRSPAQTKNSTPRDKRLVHLIHRVDDPAHRLREGEEGNDSVPVAAPGLRDGGIFSPPGAGIESAERRLAGVGVLGPVDHAQRRHDRLAIFP